MLFAAPEPELFPPAKKLSVDARKLREVYARYACFAQAIPTFRSREFAKVVKEAGLMSPTFNIKPPNRVDFVFTYACVHGPGGKKGNKSMSLEAFAFASKGIAHETGRPHEEVMECLMRAEPLLNMSDGPSIPVSVRIQQELAARAIGEDMWYLERERVSPLVQGGVLATYTSYLSQRDAEQRKQSELAQRALMIQRGIPISRSPRVATPEWAAYSSPDRRNIARRLAWPAVAQPPAEPMAPPMAPPLTPGA